MFAFAKDIDKQICLENLAVRLVLLAFHFRDGLCGEQEWSLFQSTSFRYCWD